MGADDRLVRAYDARAVHVDDRVARQAGALDGDQVELRSGDAARPGGAERARGDDFRHRRDAGAASAPDLAAGGDGL